MPTKAETKAVACASKDHSAMLTELFREPRKKECGLYMKTVFKCIYDDDSVFTVNDDGKGLGYAKCFCLQSTGHRVDCYEAGESDCV